jgi:hypothetical protein
MCQNPELQLISVQATRYHTPNPIAVGTVHCKKGVTLFQHDTQWDGYL